MKIKLLIFCLTASIFLPKQAFCESRSVFIILEGRQNEISITIKSDEKDENKTKITIDDASETIKKMKGWGSVINVIIVSKDTIQTKRINKIFEAIDENVWTDLVYFENGENYRDPVQHLLNKLNL